MTRGARQFGWWDRTASGCGGAGLGGARSRPCRRMFFFFDNNVAEWLTGQRTKAEEVEASAPRWARGLPEYFIVGLVGPFVALWGPPSVSRWESAKVHQKFSDVTSNMLEIYWERFLESNKKTNYIARLETARQIY